MITVLEVDQHTSTGNIKDFSLKDFELAQVRGGDSEAIRSLGIARAKIRQVEENWDPPWGCVWYIEDEQTGQLKFWKANYDSSG